MKVAKVLVHIGIIAMALTLVYGFTWGNGWEEVRELVRYPWFNVSLIDVYIGFALFAGWVVFREGSRAATVGWIVAIAALGNLVCCVYAAIALHRSRGDWTRFWMGARSNPSR
jgi:hypothetical protein